MVIAGISPSINLPKKLIPLIKPTLNNLVHAGATVSEEGEIILFAHVYLK